MAAANPRLVYFRVGGDVDTYFAIRRCDGQLWAANAWRGYRLCGVLSRRFRPQLVAGDIRIVVEIVPAPEVSDVA